MNSRRAPLPDIQTKSKLDILLWSFSSPSRAICSTLLTKKGFLNQSAELYLNKS